MIIQRVAVTRLEITCDRHELDNAFEYCESREFKVVRCGPKHLTNPNKQFVVAEKVMTLVTEEV